MKNKIIALTLIVSIFCISKVNAQDDFDKLMDEQSSSTPTYVTATFKSTQIINGHSIEQLKKKHLDFRVEHRFGTLDKGFSTFFGLDNAVTRIGIDYGVTDWLMLGIGRSTYLKNFDGFAKVKLLRQSTGSKNMPFSLTYIAATELSSADWSEPNRTNFFSSRMVYIHQFLIARKFSEAFSLQLSPTLVHKNLVVNTLTPNDKFSLGVGGRYKLTSRTAITAEYSYAFTNAKDPENLHNALSIGVDMETGGHVFQFFITNSSTITEGGFLWGDGNGNLSKGEIRFGFNIVRTFSYQ